MATYTLISSVTVGSGGAATIAFTSIPSTYTDLLLKLSLRTNRSNNIEQVKLRFNDDSGATAYYMRRIYADGSSVGSDSNNTSNGYIAWADADFSTASVFANNEIYIPNYTGSNQKSYSSDVVTENNATAAWQIFNAGLWTGTSAINKIEFFPDQGNNFVQYSTAYLYGISNA